MRLLHILDSALMLQVALFPAVAAKKPTMAGFRPCVSGVSARGVSRHVILPFFQTLTTDLFNLATRPLAEIDQKLVHSALLARN